jgi:hypothetical protein
MIRKTYHAEVILTVLNDYDKKLTERDISHATMEAEVRVNEIGYFKFDDNQLGVRLHIKGEKNGDNKNQDLTGR